MKPYLVNIYSKTEHLDRFLESLKNIEFDSAQVKVSHYPGNIERYRFAPKFMDKNRWVVFTDTNDVIFQKELPDFDKFKLDIVAAEENVIHRDSFWKGFCEYYEMYKELMDRPVYNAGCYAMKAYKFYEFVGFVDSYMNSCGEKEIPKMGDQLLFNKWLTKQNFITDLTIFAPLYNNFDIGLVKKEKGIWKTKNGTIISCIHENGIKHRI